MSELSDRIKKDYPGDGNNQNLDMVFASLPEKKQVELMKKFENILYGERFYEYMKGIRDGIEIFDFGDIDSEFKNGLDNILNTISQKPNSEYGVLLNQFMEKYETPDVGEPYVFKHLYFQWNKEYEKAHFSFLDLGLNQGIKNNSYYRMIPSFYYLQGLADVAEKKYGSLSAIYNILDSLESGFVYDLSKSPKEILNTIEHYFKKEELDFTFNIIYRRNLKECEGIELSDIQIEKKRKSLKPVLDKLNQCLVEKYVSSKDLGTV